MKKLIIDKSPTKREISHNFFANAIEAAEETGEEIDQNQSPISLYALRQFLAKKLISTGGRPKLLGTRKKRDKVSFIAEDWEKLEKIAFLFQVHEGKIVTPTQLAASIIHLQLSEIDVSKITY